MYMIPSKKEISDYVPKHKRTTHTKKGGIVREKLLAPGLDHSKHLLTFQALAIAKAMVGGNVNRHKTETYSESAS